jgi:hypothetical protein
MRIDRKTVEAVMMTIITAIATISLEASAQTSREIGY